MFGRAAREKEAARKRFRFVATVAVIVLGFWAGSAVVDNDVVRLIVSRFGYVGVFIVAIISGFNLLVPVPAVAFVPLFLASGLELTTTIAVIAVGVTCADSIAFLIGRAGRGHLDVESSQVVRKLEKVKKKHYWAPILLMFLYACVAPLPNEVMAMPLGFMRYRLVHVFPALLAGNIVFNAFTASGVAMLWRAM